MLSSWTQQNNWMVSGCIDEDFQRVGFGGLAWPAHRSGISSSSVASVFTTKVQRTRVLSYSLQGEISVSMTPLTGGPACTPHPPPPPRPPPRHTTTHRIPNDRNTQSQRSSQLRQNII